MTILIVGIPDGIDGSKIEHGLDLLSHALGGVSSPVVIDNSTLKITPFEKTANMKAIDNIIEVCGSPTDSSFTMRFWKAFYDPKSGLANKELLRNLSTMLSNEAEREYINKLHAHNILNLVNIALSV